MSGMLAAWVFVALALGAAGLLTSGHVLTGGMVTIVAIAGLWLWIKNHDDDERGVGPPSRPRMG
jgi:hypothetical protein